MFLSSLTCLNILMFFKEVHNINKKVLFLNIQKTYFKRVFLSFIENDLYVDSPNHLIEIYPITFYNYGSKIKWKMYKTIIRPVNTLVSGINFDTNHQNQSQTHWTSSGPYFLPYVALIKFLEQIIHIDFCLLSI